MLSIGGKEVLTTLEELVNPKHTALLLVDIQNDFIMPGGYADKLGDDLSAGQQIVPRVKRVLDAARRSGVLVVHIQMTYYNDYLAESPATLRHLLLRAGLKDSPSIEKLPVRCIEGTWGWKIVDDLAPLPNELVVRKHRASAFIGTNLDMLLRSNGIKTVTIVGVVTHGCVFSTANDAPIFEYYPVILRDCVATYKKELHDAALLIMGQARDVVDSSEVINLWTGK